MFLLKSSMFLVTFCLVGANKPSTDCLKSTVDVKESRCCNAGVPNIALYKSECKNYKTSILFPAAKYTHATDHENPCFYSCAWNLTGIMLDEKTINMDRLITFFEDMFNDYTIRNELRKYTKECVENYYDILSEWQKNGIILHSNDFRPHFGLRCSWAPIVLTACLEAKFITNCPSNRRFDLDACDQLRSFIDKCLATPVSENPNGLTIVEEQNHEAIVE